MGAFRPIGDSDGQISEPEWIVDPEMRCLQDTPVLVRGLSLEERYVDEQGHDKGNDVYAWKCVSRVRDSDVNAMTGAGTHEARGYGVWPL